MKKIRKIWSFDFFIYLETNVLKPIRFWSFRNFELERLFYLTKIQICARTLDQRLLSLRGLRPEKEDSCNICPLVNSSRIKSRAKLSCRLNFNTTERFATLSLISAPQFKMPCAQKNKYPWRRELLHEGIETFWPSKFWIKTFWPSRFRPIVSVQIKNKKEAKK